MIDPLENDLFGMPDYEETEDENFPPLPPPRSPGGRGDDAGDGENGDDLDDWTRNMGESQPEEAPKPIRRAVKRPQPKLDANRLTSQRGLPALRHLFDDTKFKGKGHEAEDLRVLLRQMENWAHRLFPKLKFEDFLNRLETLGNKKEVQTCLKRIRMDLPIFHEDFVSDEVVVQMEDDRPDSEDFPAFPEPPAPSLSQSSTAELSEETRRRIEKNRLLALEKRMQKMQALADSQAVTPTPVVSQTPPPADPDEIPEDFDEDLLEEVDNVVESGTQPAASPVVTATAETQSNDTNSEVQDDDD
ncbi:TIMELESS-interacting protein isoform X1 [Rana temporaria]|uniref:TIMELESS-interacting protein isoform X1 n=1 Tax=Rana temporaria TaxID=8407 RepID=UPI001AACBC77|nr:TIMELESS-interacting protein isoform X1 [Rana temporaria]XP_040198196.1 TIMELESS-interacting protein isoform X1 [Rana temporaria]